MDLAVFWACMSVCTFVLCMVDLKYLSKTWYEIPPEDVSDSDVVSLIIISVIWPVGILCFMWDVVELMVIPLIKKLLAK